mmetsp:Transcript_22909/g.22201  ORF Transcript_22909/g.22201 Transcript_22909/m.22201 type:complete len:96 (+) Transcript_22909:787-1074(+)
MDLSFEDISHIAKIFADDSTFLTSFGNYDAYQLGNSDSNAFAIKFNEQDIQKSLEQAVGTVGYLEESVNSILEKEQHKGVMAQVAEMFYLSTSAF